MPTNALTRIVAQGAWGTVEAVILDNGSCPAVEFFLNELEDIREGGKGEDESSAKARFAVLFQNMANAGEVPKKRHKSEMDGFYAFRHEVKNIQIRFPCFRDGKRWVLTHGFTKKTEKWQQQEVVRAQRIRAEYYLRKKKSGVTKPEGKS